MDSGFAIHIFKVDDNAPPALFTSVAKAEQELLGAITNSDTSLPYPNLAAGPNGDGRFHESGTINYDITGSPQASFTFNTKSPFPYLAPVAPGGTNNFIALEALFYVQLTAGVHTFAVRSDDGFKQTVGVTVCDTNLVLGIFDAGRGNDFPSTYDFIVQTNGLYPMRLLYFQGEFGGNIEFYSVNRTNGENILINDSSNPRAVKAYPALKTTITSVNHSGNTTSFSFKSENCRTHTVQYKNSLSDPLWQSLSPTISGDGTVKSFNDTTATGSSRFYHVMTQ